MTPHFLTPLPQTQAIVNINSLQVKLGVSYDFCLYSLQPEMEKRYTVSKTRQGVDCRSDHELRTAKPRFKLKKAGKTTRLFRYDLNQITYDYTVEVTNRFKELDLIDRVPEELWMEVH